MPISQATILAIYGDLCDLVEKIETTYNQAHQPDLFAGAKDANEAVRLALGNLLVAAKGAQEDAIAGLLRDEPTIHVNPITGRTDE
jgi:hypothetical protein